MKILQHMARLRQAALDGGHAAMVVRHRKSSPAFVRGNTPQRHAEMAALHTPKVSWVLPQPRQA